MPDKPQSNRIPLITIFLTLLLCKVAEGQNDHRLDVQALTDKIVTQCESFTDYFDVVSCINTEVAALLAGDLDKSFRQRLGQVAQKWQISPTLIDQIAPLSKLYSVLIPLNDSQDQDLYCVDFASIDYRTGRPQGGNGKIVVDPTKLRRIVHGVLQAAFFVRSYAILSFGKPFSPVLGFERVEVCSFAKYGRLLKLERNDGVLKVASTQKNNRAYGMDELNQQWSRGAAINPLVNKLTPEILTQWSSFGLEKSEAFDYYLYRKWDKLDPLGPIRILARRLAMRIASDLVGGTTPADIPSLLTSIRDKLFRQSVDHLPSRNGDIEVISRLEQAHGAEEVMHQLYEGMQRRLLNPTWVGGMVVNHFSAVERACSGTSSSTSAGRDQVGGVNVANQKTITIDVSFAPGNLAFEALVGDSYVDQHKVCGQGISSNVDRQRGMVNINLIDNVTVSVAGLGQLTDALFLMPQIALYEAVREHNMK